MQMLSEYRLSSYPSILRTYSIRVLPTLHSLRLSLPVYNCLKYSNTVRIHVTPSCRPPLADVAAVGAVGK